MKYTKVARVSEIEEGRAKLVQFEGQDVGLFRVNGRFYAIQNTCPHREGYLHEGAIQGETVTCPWHFAVFDLRTGEVLQGPAQEKVGCYEVRVEGDEIELGVP
jgi:nitrite reductase/ring-hydroxylating ferredoxin subunit